MFVGFRHLALLLLIGSAACSGGSGGPKGMDGSVVTPMADAAPPPTPDASVTAGDTGSPPDASVTGDTGSPPDADPPWTGGVVVSDNVRVLPSDGSMTIVTKAAGSLTLRGSVPVMNVGDVIVSGEGDGFARKVMAITRTGDETVLTTQPASFTEVFKHAELNVSRDFGPEDIDQGEPPAEMPMGTTGLANAGIGDIKWWSRAFDTTLYSSDQGRVKLYGEGAVGFGLDFDLRTEWWRLKKLRAVPSLHGRLTATFEAGLAIKSTNHRVRLGYFKMAKTTLTLGGVPVTIRPIVELVAVSNFQTTGGLSIALGADAMAKAGFDWQAGRGVQGIAEHKFTPTFALRQANANLSGSMSIRLEVSLLVWESVGVVAGVDLPSIAASVQSNAGSVSASAQASIAAGAGFYAQAFDQKLADQYWTLIRTDPWVFANGTTDRLFHTTWDFSPSQNPSGTWSYGWLRNTGGTFSRYTTPRRESGIVAWIDPNVSPELSVYYNDTDSLLHPSGTIDLRARQLALHPGPNGECSTVRFTPKVAGLYSVIGSFEGISGYGGAPKTTTWVGVARGFESVASAKLNQDGFGNKKDFVVEVELTPDNPLDFVVCPSNGDHRWDSTALTARVLLGTPI